MATGILAVLDDVALLMDDAAVMSNVAMKKTAGLLGDDLAVNAEKATGFHASRELPVLWAITKGSLVNKLIILPLAFLLSAYAPWLIVPILLLGGAYLCYEGVEKIVEMFVPHTTHDPEATPSEDEENREKREQAKITSAVRTDFILSIEIIVITLGTVLDQTFMVQVMVVSFIALLATVGVYGLVALLVRMDDAGLALIARAETAEGTKAASLRRSGTLLIKALPKIIRLLGYIGTVAMLLVGGGMFVHNIDGVHHILEALPALGADFLVGLIVGGVLVGGMKLFGKH